MQPEKRKSKYDGGSDREMLRERDYEPQSNEGSGSYSYRDNFDAA